MKEENGYAFIDLIEVFLLLIDDLAPENVFTRLVPALQ